MVKSKKVGSKFQGLYNYGGYWFPVKSGLRLVSFGSAQAAREAAEEKLNSLLRR